MHGEDVRLKVYVRLETANGERIAEIDDEFVVPNGSDEVSLRTEEATLARALEARVLSPARSLVRAHVNKQLTRFSFRRRTTTPPAIPLPDDTAVTTALDDKLAAIIQWR